MSVSNEHPRLLHIQKGSSMKICDLCIFAFLLSFRQSRVLAEFAFAVGKSASVVELAEAFFGKIAAQLGLVFLLAPIFALVGVGAVILHALIFHVEPARNIFTFRLVPKA